MKPTPISKTTEPCITCADKIKFNKMNQEFQQQYQRIGISHLFSYYLGEGEEQVVESVSNEMDEKWVYNQLAGKFAVNENQKIIKTLLKSKHCQKDKSLAIAELQDFLSIHDPYLIHVIITTPKLIGKLRKKDMFCFDSEQNTFFGRKIVSCASPQLENKMLIVCNETIHQERETEFPKITLTKDKITTEKKFALRFSGSSHYLIEIY